MSGSWKYAFSLSKAELEAKEPPGTVTVIEHVDNGLERDHRVLQPTPSSSSADPLNWSFARKLTILFIMSFYALSADIAAGTVAPALPLLQYQIIPPRGPPHSLGALSHLVSVNVLVFGVSNILWVPLSNIFGRRPVLIISMIICVFATVGCGLSNSLSGLLAGRAIQGFGGGPAYTIAPAVIGEIFFIHQRGRALALYTLCLAAGPSIGGVIGGYIAGTLGYKYLFWIPMALMAFATVLEIFFVPETLFVPETSRQRPVEIPSPVSATPENEKASVNTMEDIHQVTSVSARPASLSYAQSLKFGPYRGQVLTHFLAPWKSLVFPGTWMVSLQYGGLIGGIVSMATLGPVLLAQPPYLWGNNVGLFNLGGVIGTLIGALMLFCTADLLLTMMAKHRSRGSTEPETRLPLIAVGGFVATIAFWVFGFCAAHPSPHAWAGLLVANGMLSGGTVLMTSVGFTYIVDSYGYAASDCFVMTTIARSIVSFAWSYFVVDWALADGPAEVFGIFGMLMAIFALLTVPLIIWGKRMRIVTAKYFPR